MNDITSKTAVPADLRDYIASIVNDIKEMSRISTILPNGLETGGPVPLVTARHPLDPEILVRRVQVETELLGN
jgi:hypothetical protein